MQPEIKRYNVPEIYFWSRLLVNPNTFFPEMHIFPHEDFLDIFKQKNKIIKIGIEDSILSRFSGPNHLKINLSDVYRPPPGYIIRPPEMEIYDVIKSPFGNILYIDYTKKGD